MAYIIEEDYHQPDFYHFTQDSLELVRFIEEKENSWESALEVGSGCGVITGELAKTFSSGKFLVLEKLKEFRPYLEKNLSSYPHVQMKMTDFLKFETDKSFDLIYFNPPYFYEESSRPSLNQLKNQCRQIKSELFQQWIIHAKKMLSSRGRLYFCHRDKHIIAEDWGFKLKEKREKKGCILYSWALF